MSRGAAPIGAIGVVGAGAVGQATAAALVSSGLASRLLVTSRTSSRTAALVTDLDDMRTALRGSTHPLTSHPADLMDCDAVVVALRASFTNSRATDVRMAGASANGALVAWLAGKLRGYGGTVLMVTNPVDLMARLFADASGCRRVYGIGSALDTARYRTMLAAHVGAPLAAVSGQVIGEHGDHLVVCASSTTVNDEPADVPVRVIFNELCSRPGRISAGIGRTRYGPAGAVLEALHLALGLADGTTQLSTAYQGGWLGIPLRFTAGQPIPCLPRLTPGEAAHFRAADAKLRTAYEALGPVLDPIPSLSERTLP
ncbi:NAD(P)-binding domain-containing protein [Streptomyces sp. NEAU-YJ-81]|uniref:lactate/malate family dehydrogenase n=1 Tax=Streptomyces sp. NEAU-YJ-81 TaxID=2820288 RepID=UPI001ABD1747|nr:NAD(P)-binding domain-containing protein [Streptomyces sp. NEAU-YJ-81]MBO3682724.1 NAD(P)-binding domain-containing protein [Streptomyces sp. NEAU-YJ-81]